MHEMRRMHVDALAPNALGVAKSISVAQRNARIALVSWRQGRQSPPMAGVSSLSFAGRFQPFDPPIHQHKNALIAVLRRIA